MKRLIVLGPLLFTSLACGDDTAPAADAGHDAGVDAGHDAGIDAGIDAGHDAGPTPAEVDTPTKGPWVMQAETDRALVRWESRVAASPPAIEVRDEATGGVIGTFTGSATPSEVALAYGPGNDLIEAPDYPGTWFLNDVVLEGLTPATCYTYLVANLSAPPEIPAGGRFCTAHAPEDHESPITFLFIADTSPLIPAVPELLSATMNDDVEFIVHGGDVQYYDAVLDTWQLFFDVFQREVFARGAFYPAIGNHEEELEGEFEDYYARFFDVPSRDGSTSNYHFETGGVHFFSVNSESDIGEYDADASWLDEQLTRVEADPNHRFSIVYFHRPYVTLARHAPNERVRDMFDPVITAHEVPLVLTGHNHCYERFLRDGRTFVVAGGGGAILYDCDAQLESFPALVPDRQASGRFHHALRITIGTDEISGQAIDREGERQDEFTIDIVGEAL